MERRISLWLYAAAFAMSLAMFLTGLYVGSIIDRSNVENISTDVMRISERVSSLQLLLLMDEEGPHFCPLYSSELAAIDEEVELLGYRLSFLEDTKQIMDPELKKRYFVLEAESYLLSKKARSLCGGDEVLLINFYSNLDCDDCIAQGQEILRMRDALSSKGRSIKLYSFDGTLGSPIADALAARYGVTTYPTVVIEDVSYPGYRSSDELARIVLGASP